MQKHKLLLTGALMLTAYIVPFQSYASTDYNYDVTYICGHSSYVLATNTPAYWCSFPQFPPVPGNDFYSLSVKTTSTLETIVMNNNNVFGGTGTTTIWIAKYSSSTGLVTTSSIGFIPFDVVTPQRKTFSNIGIEFSPNDRFSLGYNNTGTVQATKLVAQAQLFFNETSSIEIMTSSTDAIVGNTFNQIYLIIWLLFFLFIFYISYRIAGGPKLFKK